MIQHLDKVLFCKLKWKVLCRFCTMQYAFCSNKVATIKAFSFRNKINVESQNCRHYSRAINWICTISRFLQLNFIWFCDCKNQGLWSHKNKTDKILLIFKKLPKLVHKSNSRLFQIKWISNHFLTKIRIFEMGNFWNLFLFTLS